MRRLAGAGKPIWITESGISSRPKARRLANASERAQAAWVIKHHVFHVASGVKRVVWLSFTDMGGSVPEGLTAKYAGLLTFRPTRPKLSYYAYKEMVEVLEGSDWENAEAVHEKDGIYVYRFDKAGKPIWVAWNDNKQPRAVRILMDGSVKDAIITEAVPKYPSGIQVVDYKTAFNSVRGRILDDDPQQLVFDLGSSPVFVTGN